MLYYFLKEGVLMGKELGVCIKHFRNQKKMTQEELAKAVGVAN